MNIAIAFATLSGNTVSVATNLQEYLVEQGHLVTLYDMLELSTSALQQHELVFLGCSTYEDGNLNPIAEMFLSAMQIEETSYEHTKFAIFSLGDSAYEHFATGGQILYDNLSAMGASFILPILTLDGYPDEEMYARARSWAEDIIKLQQPL